jgi:4-hydroxybenzoate polyprenyltransferase
MSMDKVAIDLKGIVNLIRFHEYGPVFIFAGLFGALLTFTKLNLSILNLMVFIASSSAFGFAINDISDRFLDALSKNIRNPISKGVLTLKTAQFTAFILFIISIISLMGLNQRILPIGILQLFLFITYSFILKAKDKIILDIFYHSIGPALYGIMGYILFKKLDSIGVIFTIVVTIFGAVSELVQEIRDYEKDVKIRKNTVWFIGKKNALLISAVLMLTSFLLIAILGLVNSNFRWVLPLTPLGALLIQPLIKARAEIFQAELPRELNKRSIIIASIVIIFFIFNQVFGIL